MRGRTSRQHLVSSLMHLELKRIGEVTRVLFEPGFMIGEENAALAVIILSDHENTDGAGPSAYPREL